MSGILANSASVNALTSVSSDATLSGFKVGERVGLCLDNGASATWEILTKPEPSGASLSARAFTPNVAGDYLVRATETDGTEHLLRITVSGLASGFAGRGVLFSPTTSAQVLTPKVGETVYVSAGDGALHQVGADGVDAAV